MKASLDAETLEQVKKYGVHIINFEERAKFVAALCEVALRASAPRAEALSPDARRYRWLRDTDKDNAEKRGIALMFSAEKFPNCPITNDDVDAAIDAAMSAGGISPLGSPEKRS